MATTERVFDCAILGSGIGGSMLGAVLARQGLRVLLLDAGTHPRFAIGEATTPDTSFRLKLLSLKYDVPEIMNLASFHHLRDRVSPACGVKRAFSFLYQKSGQEQDPLESHQYPTLAPPMGPDCHFFRQDTDAYIFAAAVNHGATVRQQVRVADIEFQEEQVLLTTEAGEVLRTRFLVDAAGFRSPLAEKFDLREDPRTLRTDSRTIFTHMVGVHHYDSVGAPPSRYGLKYPLSQSTLHHIFEGGWFWIIPFNNHDDAVNPICSVGLVLNRELHPETGRDPEEEFFHYVQRFPSMVRQFEGARAVRNWISTGRMNYASKRTVGHRYCLLAHASGFIDPLFSSGLNLTTGHVDILARHLLQAFKTGDFSPEAFQPVDDFFQAGLHHYDEVISSAFVAFRDYELWDAWFRVWVVGLLIGTCLNANLYLRYLETGDRAILRESEQPPYGGVLGSQFSPYRPFYDRALETMDQVRDGSLEPRQAASDLRSLWAKVPFVPSYFQWQSKEVRTTPAFTVWGVTKMYFWFLFRSPKMRRELFNWNPLTGYAYILKNVLEQSRLSRRRSRQYLRDVFRSWNTDGSVPHSKRSRREAQP